MKRNPSPNAPWIELVLWEPRPRYRGAKRAPVDLTWIDGSTISVDEFGLRKADAWRISFNKSMRRVFEKTIAHRWLRSGSPSASSFGNRFGPDNPIPESDLTDWRSGHAVLSAEIGWHDIIDEKTFRAIGLPGVIAMGPQGIELLRMMQRRWRELYEQGPPKAKKKR